MGDILIKGMEMPSIDLEWRVIRGQDGKWYAIDVNAETSDGEWHEIVPVPPHGDLVDRDETIKAGKSHPTYKNSKIVKAVVDKACCFLKTATVVIPANKEN